MKKYKFFISYDILVASNNLLYFKIGFHNKGAKYGIYIDTLACRTWLYIKKC